MLLKRSLEQGDTVTFKHDEIGRRLKLSAIGQTPTTIEALTYQNDAAGNRIKLTRASAAASLIPQAVTNTAFDAANEQTQFNSASTNLVYDNNGNLTSFTDASGTTTYTWNARNQLTAISGPSLSASFVYDGLGRRTSKAINSTTTGFWYDGTDVLAELSGSTPTATYIRSLSIDEPFIRKQSGGDEFYQTDALRTTLTLSDGSGASNTTYTQEPFGKTTKTGTSANSFQFTGRENDGTGLYYYRARYYSTSLNRFVGEDLFAGYILVPETLNRYSYVLNDPLYFRDPSRSPISSKRRT
ncbi:RHS repeat-associated core domain-containing protein [Nitrospira sp. Nam80]